ncbi:MAG: hypothetical protein K0R17_3639 [Rariglobus sp.]|jgi:hypothetical protein|nr:hypothetical protein [Rariglobus sp.]
MTLPSVWHVVFFLCLTTLAGWPVSAHAADDPSPQSLVVPALPSWVRDPLQVDPAASLAISAATAPTTPTRLHFVEVQIDVDPIEEFRHYALRVETEAGLQSSGQLSVDFAPGYQTLRWHFVRIWRDGKPRDVLTPSALRILHQEENAERFLYHGRITAHLVLHDLRVGDLVETAYTVSGANPVFQGRFSTFLSGTGSAPIDRLSYRVRTPTTRPIHAEVVGPFKPVHRKVQADGHDEHFWSAENIPPVSALRDVPSHVVQFSYIQITEFTDWEDVRRWARTLFDSTGRPSPGLMDRVQPLLADAKTTEAKANALLRFVQDDVRYLGLHLNESTHRPANPEEVIERRFGDCKDKSLLLVMLLRELGYEADVALVSSAWRRGLAGLQPSPLSFDHAIVRVKEPSGKRARVSLQKQPPAPVKSTLRDAASVTFNATLEDTEVASLHFDSDDVYLWIDPTAQLQGGGFSQRHVPDYGYALVLDPASAGLVKVTPRSEGESWIDVHELYTITDYTSPVTLEITINYRGAEADGYRYFRRVADSARYTQQMTGYLARFRPKIKSKGQVAWEDHRDRNLLTARFTFEIEDFWTTDASGHVRMIEFYPWYLSDRLTRPETIERIHPFGLSHPSTVVQRTDVLLPKDWPVSNDVHEVDDDTFAYKHSAKVDGSRATLIYQWRTLADTVPAERLVEWNRKMDEVRAGFGYKLTQNIRIAEAITQKGVVWSVIGSLVLGATAGGALGVFLYRWKPAKPPCPSAHRHLEGIGGWLILLAIGVVIRPLIQLGMMKDTFGLIGNRAGWITMADTESVSYLAGYAPLVWTETFIQGLFLAWAAVMVVQFFRCRSSLPKSLSALLLLAVAWEIIDLIVVTRMLPGESPPNYVRPAGHVIVTIAWVCYLHVSRRVHATFRNPRSKSITPPPLPPQMPAAPPLPSVAHTPEATT